MKLREREDESSGRRLRDSAKRWGRHLLLSGMIGASALSIGSCNEPKNEETTPFQHTGIWAEPYDGGFESDNGEYYMRTRFILKFNNPTEINEVDNAIKGIAGRVTGQIPQLNAFEVETQEGVDAAVLAMNNNSSVQYATRNYVYRAASSMWDNDRYITDGDDPSNGQAPEKGLWWSNAIQLSGGLDLIEGSGTSLKSVTIAIIDGGFYQKDHEVPYVDKGYHLNLAGGDSSDLSPPDYFNFSYRPHGTNVAKFSAAINNGIKTNGVASGTQNAFQILPLKFLPASPYTDPAILQSGLIGDNFRVSAGLIYIGFVSDQLNVKVVNLSINIGEPKINMSLTGDAIDALQDKGIVIVASVGNDNNDACKVFPSSYTKVISVGGTRLDNGKEKRYVNSNYSSNPDCLEIAAPGQDLLIFDENGNPSIGNGTSFAAPQVSGLVAIIKAVKPESTYEEVLNLLRNNADDIALDDDTNPDVQGQTWKRINVQRTVNALVQPQYQPQLCAIYPESGANRYTFTVMKQLPVCNSDSSIYLDHIDADGTADFVVFNSSETNSYRLNLYQQFTTITPGIPATVELCGKSQPCSYTMSANDNSCTATLAWDSILICP